MRPRVKPPLGPEREVPEPSPAPRPDPGTPIYDQLWMDNWGHLLPPVPQEREEEAS